MFLLCLTAFQLQAKGAVEVPSYEAEGNKEYIMDKGSEEERPMMEEDGNVIYLAGGCFWGLEHLMQSLNGVIDAQSGYANGSGEKDANYRTIIKGGTGFKETVRVLYDPEKTSLDAILFAYFYVIDPSVRNRQGNDVGTQYQTGIYYTNEKAKAVVERVVSIEKGRTKDFFVEVEPLRNFYPAEEYHQDYLEKNPAGYCHSDSALVKEQKRIEGELATFEKNLWSGNIEKKDSLDSIAKADKNVKGKVKKAKKSNRRGSSSSSRQTKVKEQRSSSFSSASSGSARVTVRRQRH